MSQPEITFQVDGETVRVDGLRRALVASKSTAGDWYVVEHDDESNRWVCTCKGYECRRSCRHVTAIVRLDAGEADVRPIFDEGSQSA